VLDYGNNLGNAVSRLNVSGGQPLKVRDDRRNHVVGHIFLARDDLVPPYRRLQYGCLRCRAPAIAFSPRCLSHKARSMDDAEVGGHRYLSRA
jgi:hypothetical protein